MTLDFNGFEVSAPDDLRVALCMVVLCAKLEPDSRHTHTQTHSLSHSHGTYTRRSPAQQSRVPGGPQLPLTLSSPKGSGQLLRLPPRKRA